MAMAEEKGATPSVMTQIVTHAMNKEPSKITPLVNKEISARVMAGIDAKRAEVGKKLFSK